MSLAFVFAGLCRLRVCLQVAVVASMPPGTGHSVAPPPGHVCAAVSAAYIVGFVCSLKRVIEESYDGTCEIGIDRCIVLHAIGRTWAWPVWRLRVSLILSLFETITLYAPIKLSLLVACGCSIACSSIGLDLRAIVVLV